MIKNIKEMQILTVGKWKRYPNFFKSKKNKKGEWGVGGGEVDEEKKVNIHVFIPQD